MSDFERFIGKFEEFMKNTKECLQQNRDDHERLLTSIDDLKSFKWKVTGMATMFSTAAAAIISLISRFI